MQNVCRWHARWARFAVPLVGSLLIAGCGSEPRQVTSSEGAAGGGATPSAALRPCGDPSLQPLQPVANGTTVAVQYPADQLQRPARLARPFPLTDPRSPLPFITIPRPSIRGARPVGDSAIRGVDALTSTGSLDLPDGVEPLPPIDDSQTIEPLPPVDIPGDVEPLPEIEPLREIEPSAQAEPQGQAESQPHVGREPQIEPLPAVEPLPEVELPAELPAKFPAEATPSATNTPVGEWPYRADDVPAPPPVEVNPRDQFGSAGSTSENAPRKNRTPRAALPAEPQAAVAGPALRSTSTRNPFPAEMEAVARRAQQMIQHGYELGGRGALYSARAEFISAMRTMVQALDVQAGSRRHSQALAAGLNALDEAEHFIPQGSRLEADLDLGALVRAHRTPVAKDLPEDKLLPVLVLQRYYTYAQEQFTVAAGGQEAASMALFGLGKTYTALAGQQAQSIVAPEPKAMVFHQAALSTDPGNFLAANELAVLASHYGQYTTARALLQYSISISPHSSVWKNLAAVHKRLGEERLAQAAEREAVAATRREATAKLGNREGIIPSSEITWVDPETFAGKSRQTVEWQTPAAVSTTAGEKPAGGPDRSATKSRGGWWR